MERKHVQQVELALLSNDQYNQSFHGSTWALWSPNDKVAVLEI